MRVPVHVSDKGARRRRRKHRLRSQDWSNRSKTSLRLWSSTNARGTIWQGSYCRSPAVIAISHGLSLPDGNGGRQLAWLVQVEFSAQAIAVFKTPRREVRSRGATSGEGRRPCLYHHHRRPLLRHKVFPSRPVTDLRLSARRLHLNLLRRCSQPMLRYNRP